MCLRKGAAVGRGRSARVAEHRERRCAAARERLGDSFTLERVRRDPRRHRRAACCRGQGRCRPSPSSTIHPAPDRCSELPLEQSETLDVLEERVEKFDCVASPAFRQRADPDAGVGSPIGGGKDPAVTGNGRPTRLLPEHDRRQGDICVDVRAHCESPLDPRPVDEACVLGDATRRAVCADDRVCLDGPSVCRLELCDATFLWRCRRSVRRRELRRPPRPPT